MTTAHPGHVLVVGASAAGLSTVEALRRRHYQGRITVLGDEAHAPYDRPPLSKQVLSGTWEPDRAALRNHEVLAALDAEFLLGEAAVSLEPVSRTVTTASGRDLGADAVVIATGARARSFPGAAGLAGVHVLRTLDHTLALRKEITDGSRVVVVGEGVLGAEIAATARAVGADVTLTGPLAAPMALQLGPWVSGLLADLHRAHGVHLRLGTPVQELVGADGQVTGVRLGTGDIVPADAVVVAIGAAPATDWLRGSGLHLENGVVCDTRCRAADGIYAVGDVARWHHAHLGGLVRLENRTNATEQADTVAATILGEDRPYVPVPYFWTDQYDVKVQVFGIVDPAAEVDVVEGDPATGRFVARYRVAGATTAVLGWNMPKQVRLHRPEVADALATPVPLH